MKSKKTLLLNLLIVAAPLGAAQPTETQAPGFLASAADAAKASFGAACGWMANTLKTVEAQGGTQTAAAAPQSQWQASAVRRAGVGIGKGFCWAGRKASEIGNGIANIFGGKGPWFNLYDTPLALAAAGVYYKAAKKDTTTPCIGEGLAGWAFGFSVPQEKNDTDIPSTSRTHTADDVIPLASTASTPTTTTEGNVGLTRYRTCANVVTCGLFPALAGSVISAAARSATTDGHVAGAALAAAATTWATSKYHGKTVRATLGQHPKTVVGLSSLAALTVLNGLPSAGTVIGGALCGAAGLIAASEVMSEGLTPVQEAAVTAYRNFKHEDVKAPITNEERQEAALSAAISLLNTNEGLQEAEFKKLTGKERLNEDGLDNKGKKIRYIAIKASEFADAYVKRSLSESASLAGAVIKQHPKVC